MKRFVATIVSGLATIVCAAPPEYHSLVSADTPLLWYQFDDASGATSTPNFGSLGSSYDGVFFNTLSPGEPSFVGDTSLGFAAVNQPYVDSVTAVPASLTGNPTFTVETVVWVEDDATGMFYSPFLHWGSANTGLSVYFSVYRTSADRMYVGFFNGGLRAKCTMRNNAWNHIVWVRDSAGGTNGQYEGSTLYVNGKPVALEPDTSLPGAAVINVQSSSFRVQRARSLTRFWTGKMDEIALYDTLLTPEQIKARFLALQFNDPACPADFNVDCAVNTQDFIDFLNAWNQNEPHADYNNDTFFNTADFIAFLNVFAAGC